MTRSDSSSTRAGVVRNSRWRERPDMKRSAIIVATAAIAVVAGGPLAAVTLTGKAHTTAAVTASVATDPTAGLKEYTDTYKVQKPYNLPVSARFSVTNGEYNAWILK